MTFNGLHRWLFPRSLSRSQRAAVGPARGRRSGTRLGSFRPAIEPLEVRLIPSIVPASSPIDVTTGAGGQSVTTHRTAAEASDGSYRVVWENAAQGSIYGIYTRLFSAS